VVTFANRSPHAWEYSPSYVFMESTPWRRTSSKVVGSILDGVIGIFH